MTLEDNVKKFVETVCHGETILTWETIDQRVDEFYATAGKDQKLIQLVKDGEERIKLCRKRQLKKRKQSLINIVKHGDYDPDEFDWNMILLYRLAENQDQTQAIAKLEELRALEQIEDEVTAAIRLFEIEHEGGTAIAVAKNKYLDPIIQKLKDLIAFLPTNFDLISLLKKINDYWKNVENINTLVTTGKFQRIIMELQMASPQHTVPLLDEYNKSHGTAKRDEALKWYRTVADNYIREKANLHWRLARNAVSQHNPGLAQHEIDKGKSILISYQISDLLNELKDYEREKIAPLIERISYAKDHFFAVCNTTIYDALDHYKKAIDSEKGWPYFDTIIFNPDDNEFARDQVNPALQARQCLYEKLDQFYRSRLAQSEHSRLPRSDIQIMTDHLEFDSRFQKYVNRVLPLNASQQLPKQLVQANIFISYRRSSSIDFAPFLGKTLKDYINGDIFLDIHNFKISSNYRIYISNQIHKCDVFLLIVSKGTFDRINEPDDMVFYEIHHALDKNKIIIPILHKDGEFPQELPDAINSIRQHAGIRVRPEHEFEASIKTLVNMIEQRDS